MAQHPIESLMKTAMENIKAMVDVTTIIGNPIETPDGQVIIPVSKVGFGFAAGGSQFGGLQTNSSKIKIDQKNGNEVCDELDIETNEQADEERSGSYPFGGGSGGGVSITPVAFIVVNGNEVRVLNMEGATHLYDRVIDLIDKATSKKRKQKKADDNSPQMYC